MGIGALIGGVVGSVVGRGASSKPGKMVAPKEPNKTQTTGYQDQWIRDEFAQGQSQIDELTKFMNERRAALAQPKFVSVGGGEQIEQSKLGEYVTDQLSRQREDLSSNIRSIQDEQAAAQARASIRDTSLANLGAITSANRAGLSSFGTNLANLTTQQATHGTNLANLASLQSSQGTSLADLTAMSNSNRAAMIAQGEAAAQRSQRERLQSAYGMQPTQKNVTSVFKNTGSGFNRAGMRILGLNV